MRIKSARLSLIKPEPPLSVLVFLFDLFSCHLLRSLWAVACLLGAGTGSLSADWEWKSGGETSSVTKSWTRFVLLLGERAERCSDLRSPALVVLVATNLIVVFFCSSSFACPHNSKSIKVKYNGNVLQAHFYSHQKLNKNMQFLARKFDNY